MYSTITRKKCKCSPYCDKWPTMGYGGYFSSHAPKELIEKIGTKKQVAQRNRNNRLALGRKLRIAQNEVEIDAQAQWFLDRRKEMTGRCLFCNGKTEKNNDKTFTRSIAHLLAKRSTMFPSVATHNDNWLELCFYGNSCHTNFDQSVITWEFLKDSFEWTIIVEKFKKIYPSIAEREKKNIPQLLLETL